MRFEVRSRWDMMGQLPPEVPWSLISICEKGDFPTVQENDFLRGRLNLQFHDADGFAYDPSGVDIILFNESMAGQVLDFTQSMIEVPVSVMYVHCLMGQARSAAVAAALSKALLGDDSRYFGNGFYKPNMLVYRHVLNECHERGLIG